MEKEINQKNNKPKTVAKTKKFVEATVFIYIRKDIAS